MRSTSYHLFICKCTFEGDLRTALVIEIEKCSVLFLLARRGLGAAPRLLGQSRGGTGGGKGGWGGGGVFGSLFRQNTIYGLVNELIEGSLPRNSESYPTAREPRASKTPSDSPWEALRTPALPVTRPSPRSQRSPSPATRTGMRGEPMEHGAM